MPARLPNPAQVSVFSWGCAGLENYTAVEERLVEYVSAPQNVVTLNAQLTQLATQQLENYAAGVCTTQAFSTHMLPTEAVQGRGGHDHTSRPRLHSLPQSEI